MDLPQINFRGSEINKDVSIDNNIIEVSDEDEEE
jgi:hypothetical protein